MGAIAAAPLPTYPDGFPDPLVRLLERATGHRFICNRPYNGIAAIDDYGALHLRDGALILYTSQDSVLQLAAHGDVLAEAELYEVCAAAREVMTGEHAVGRVIARPFAGEPGAFRRTDGRHDLSIPPPGRTYLDELHAAGVPVHAVGKVSDLFAGRGIDVAHPGATNERALRETTRLIGELDAGLVFTNLVETDQVYGHRKDVEGFHAALRAIDAAVGEWLGAAARRRPARDHRRPRLRPGRAAQRSHARARSAARALRRRSRPPPRRRARRRRRERAALADGRRRRGAAGHVVRAGLGSTPMPELPEVETIRRRLAPLVEGRTLRTLEVLDPKWCAPLHPQELRDALEGRMRSSACSGAASTSSGRRRTRSTCSCTCA